MSSNAWLQFYIIQKMGVSLALSFPSVAGQRIKRKMMANLNGNRKSKICTFQRITLPHLPVIIQLCKPIQLQYLLKVGVLHMYDS